VLSFDAAFDAEPHLQLLKEMLTQVFATPRRHHKSKPFFDHVLGFTVADGRIWVRNYQVRWWGRLQLGSWALRKVGKPSVNHCMSTRAAVTVHPGLCAR
jgi:hypothetical protein